MGKSKRIKIPKNRDMSEMFGQEDKIKTMQDVMDIIDNKRKKFIEEIKLPKEDMIAMEKKLQKVYARKDAQLADKKRKEAYIKMKGLNPKKEALDKITVNPNNQWLLLEADDSYVLTAINKVDDIATELILDKNIKVLQRFKKGN